MLFDLNNHNVTETHRQSMLREAEHERLVREAEGARRDEKRVRQDVGQKTPLKSRK